MALLSFAEAVRQISLAHAAAYRDEAFGAVMLSDGVKNKKPGDYCVHPLGRDAQKTAQQPALIVFYRGKKVFELRACISAVLRSVLFSDKPERRARRSPDAVKRLRGKAA